MRSLNIWFTFFAVLLNGSGTLDAQIEDRYGGRPQIHIDNTRHLGLILLQPRDDIACFGNGFHAANLAEHRFRKSGMNIRQQGKRAADGCLADGEVFVGGLLLLLLGSHTGAGAQPHADHPEEDA